MNEESTKTQVSAGGVAFRQRDDQIEVAIISVGKTCRWQLPKGKVNTGESTEAAAVREVCEETGLQTTIISLIDTVDYWYAATNHGQRMQYHKFVYFYLLRYQSGDTRDHDDEVNEARWVEVEQAYDILTFESEKGIAKRAKALIHALT